MDDDRTATDEGFTLIELMVVTLIVAILLAIAVPTFLGSRLRAQDRVVQTNLRNATTAARTIVATEGDYQLVTPAALTEVEPSLDFVAVAIPSSGPGEVSVGSRDNEPGLPGHDEIVLVARSESGRCFATADVVGPTAPAGRVVGVAFGEVLGPCAAESALGLPAAAWHDSF